jgi:hypothetical protein
MAAIKSLNAIADKWSTVTPQRQPDYEAGIQQPRRPWQQATAAAADAYRDGVTKAAQQGTFARGVNKAGDEAWRTGALTKGTARWGPGVQLATEKYAAGFAPYRAAIERLTLPPRFARRDPRNLQRVAAVVAAMTGAATGTTAAR